MILIVALSLCGLVIFSLSIYLLKYVKLYKNLQEKVSGLISDLNKPLRLGYYKLSCIQGNIKYKGIVSVYEIDRYTNGDSGILLKKIELSDISNSGLNMSSAIDFIKSDIPSIMKTADITWLESETEIKEQRRSKLKRLKEISDSK